MRELLFNADGTGRLALPNRCSVDISCLRHSELQDAVLIALEENLYRAALAGIDLTGLDGITVAADCQAAANAMQNLPAGEVPLEMSAQPDFMEMARTAAVHRDGELRFHILLRPGLMLMALSPEEKLQRV